MYCQEINCSQQIIPGENIYGENYCPSHQNVCWENCFPQGCSIRISSDNWYCTYHHDYYKNLVGQKTGLTNIQDVKRLTTWWNNNLATVVNGTGPYSIWLIVYEPSQNNDKIKEVLEKFLISEEIIKKKLDKWYDDYKYDLEHVKIISWSVNLSNQHLIGNNPILLIHPKTDVYANFNEIITSPYVKRIDLPVETKWEWVKECTCYPDCPCYHCDCQKLKSEFVYPDNPDDYIKPLDIVKVGRSILGNDFQHVGLYLGNKQVCHVNDNSSKKRLDTRDSNCAIITDWETFVGFPDKGRLIAFHPVIPFKNHKKIVQQIAWTEANKYSQGAYCVANKNCEHFANMIVYGINFSEQVENNPSKSSNHARYQGVNNGKGSINLRNEISQVNNQFGNSDNYRASQIQALVVVPPKKNCQIM